MLASEIRGGRELIVKSGLDVLLVLLKWLLLLLKLLKLLQLLLLLRHTLHGCIILQILPMRRINPFLFFLKNILVNFISKCKEDALYCLWDHFYYVFDLLG